MKTLTQINQKLEQLRKDMTDLNCPCGCQDETRHWVEGQIKILEWVLEDVDEERSR